VLKANEVRLEWGRRSWSLDAEPRIWPPVDTWIWAAV